jgi:hypothetical protein
MKENAPPEVRGEVGSKTKHAHLDHPSPSRKIVKAVLAEVEEALDRANGYEYEGYSQHTAELCRNIALKLRRRVPALQALSLVEAEGLITDAIRMEVEDALHGVGFDASEYVLDEVRDRLDLLRFFDNGETA